MVGGSQAAGYVGVSRRRSSMSAETRMWSNSLWPSGYIFSAASGDGRPSARGVSGGGVNVARSVAPFPTFVPQ